MEVILTKDSELGDRGAVINVAPGFARNYLIPNGLAVIKTKGSLKHAQEIERQRAKKIEKEKAEVLALAKKINEAAPIILKAKGGENGVMFGSITHDQIAQAIKENLGVEIDKRRILVRSIKEAGETVVPLKLTFGIIANAKFKVELEIEKKKEEVKVTRRKPRKKEEIRAEIEAAEAAAKASSETNEKKETVVASEKVEDKTKKKTVKKTESAKE